MERITELQDQIIRKIYEDNKCTTHFEFSDDFEGPKGPMHQRKKRLEVSTYNPSHGQKFLFGIFVGDSPEQCLEMALKQLESGENNYTVSWKNSDSPIQNSYFRANNMMEALQKFYYGRENDGTVTVFECKLNPIS